MSRTLILAASAVLSAGLFQTPVFAHPPAHAHSCAMPPPFYLHSHPRVPLVAMTPATCTTNQSYCKGYATFPFSYTPYDVGCIIWYDDGKRGHSYFHVAANTYGGEPARTGDTGACVAVQYGQPRYGADRSYLFVQKYRNY